MHEDLLGPAGQINKKRYTDDQDNHQQDSGQIGPCISTDLFGF